MYIFLFLNSKPTNSICEYNLRGTAFAGAKFVNTQVDPVTRKAPAAPCLQKSLPDADIDDTEVTK